MLAIPFTQAVRAPMFRNSTIVYPKATSGLLWVGNICSFDFNATSRSNGYPSIRIDDVSFARIGCNDGAQPIASVTSIATLLSASGGTPSGAEPSTV
jgi:hypothetical protein